MNLGPFLKSLLLILQLNEFLGPKQLCFIIDDEDQSLLHALNVLENLGNNFVGVITCESFLTRSWLQAKTVFVATSPCHGLAAKEWPFWKNNSLILMPDTESIAKDLSMHLNSRVYHLDSNFSLYEIFQYQSWNTSYVKQKIGDTSTRDFTKNSDYIWKRRSNLNSTQLAIIYGNYPPLTWKGNNSVDVRGLYGEIFFALQEKLLFQYTIHHQEDNMWGTLQENGSYSGMFGQIQNGKMNWSIADTTITWERSEFFDFSIPIMRQHRRLVTRKPIENFDSLSYVGVFSSQFWIALLVSGFVLVLLMFWILLINPLHDQDKSSCLAQAFAFIVLSLFGREIFSLDTNWSGKILCLVVVVWGFLISVSYNAILTSFLASAITVQSLDSLEDLLASNDYTLFLKADGSIRDYFARATENSTDGQLFKKFLKLKPNLNWKKSPIPIEIFTSDAVLMLTDIDIYDTVQEYDLHCEIFIHPGKYFMGSSSAFALQKDSPLKEVIDYQLLKFLQSGLLEQLSEKYIAKKQLVCLPPVQELDFKATALSFAILALGVATALIVSFVEKIKDNLKNRQHW